MRDTFCACRPRDLVCCLFVDSVGTARYASPWASFLPRAVYVTPAVEVITSRSPLLAATAWSTTRVSDARQRSSRGSAREAMQGRHIDRRESAGPGRAPANGRPLIGVRHSRPCTTVRSCPAAACASADASASLDSSGWSYDEPRQHIRMLSCPDRCMNSTAPSFTRLAFLSSQLDSHASLFDLLVVLRRPSCVSLPCSPVWPRSRPPPSVPVRRSAGRRSLTSRRAGPRPRPRRSVHPRRSH